MNDNTPRGDSGLGNAREKIKEKAADLAGNAKDAVRGQYHKGLTSVVGELNNLSSALRTVGEQMREQDHAGVAAMLTSRIADRIDSFGNSLDGRDLEEVIESVETFARRNPAVFLGSAAAIGFVLARFAKSSASAAMQSTRASASMRTGGYTSQRDTETSSDYSSGLSSGLGRTSQYETGASAPAYGTGASVSEFGTGTTGSGIGSGTTPRSGGTPTSGSDFGTGSPSGNDFGTGSSGIGGSDKPGSGFGTGGRNQ